MGKKKNNLLGKRSLRLLNGNLVLLLECYPTSFNITLSLSGNIPKGSRLKAHSEKATVFMKKNAEHKVSVKRTVSYRKDLDGMVVAIPLSIKYTKNRHINGTLTLQPELYLPLGIRKSAEQRESMKQDFPIETHSQPIPLKTFFVPYQYINPHRPYRG